MIDALGVGAWLRLADPLRVGVCELVLLVLRVPEALRLPVAVRVPLTLGVREGDFVRDELTVPD